MTSNNQTFHQGEVALQEKAGAVGALADIGARFIRDYMPTQHQEFFQQLPMIFVGFVDDNQDTWASVIVGEPGFVSSPTDKILTVNQGPITGDPLNQVLVRAHETGQSPRLGFLGIELPTRRRNRLSGQLKEVTAFGFTVDVVQSFGNCPKYIQVRHIDNVQRSNSTVAEPIEGFVGELATAISQADTFFVASSSALKASDNLVASDGADVSHRGGQAGFIRIDDELTLTIPDYTGNNFFNTLGNIQVNPRTGLLFINFATGDIYMLTGRAKILWDDADVDDFLGAERLWQFSLTKGYKLKAAFPWRFVLDEWSPYSLMTGTWSQLNEKRETQAKTNPWLNQKIVKVVDESHLIRSYYFAKSNLNKPQFLPGQHLSIKVHIDGKDYIRNYTVSSAPQDEFWRISVKRQGEVSAYLHDFIHAGDTLDIKRPQGSFHLSQNPDRPVVLIGAGVGITPMISIFRFILNEVKRGAKPRKVLLVAAVKNQMDLVFQREVYDLISEAGEFAQAIWFVSDMPSAVMQPNMIAGRISGDFLAGISAQGQHEYYLCGPDGFMQHTYNILSDLGVDDGLIFAEAFGPSALERKAVNQQVDPAPSPSAVVTFTQAHTELVWQPSHGTLLEFAESHGLSPEFGCRLGACGSCKVKLKQGRVTHTNIAKVKFAHNEALLCCAMPASDNLIIDF